MTMHSAFEIFLGNLNDELSNASSLRAAVVPVNYRFKYDESIYSLHVGYDSYERNIIC